MMHNRSFRQLLKSDFPDFKRLINNAWHTDSYIHTPAVLDAALDAYMHLCLISATCGIVALDSESAKVQGILVCSARARKPLFSKIMHIRHLIRDIFVILCASRADRTAVFGLLDEFSYDKQLLRGKEKRYDGQMHFFVVDSSARGAGIGKKLLELMYNYFSECRVKRFYLFTDTWCNYQFYDRQGFNRAASLYLPPEGGEHGQHGQNQVFLYEKDL